MSCTSVRLVRIEAAKLSEELRPSALLNPQTWLKFLKSQPSQLPQLYDELAFIQTCSFFWEDSKCRVDNSSALHILNDWVQDIKRAIPLLKDKSFGDVWEKEVLPILCTHKANMRNLQDEALKLWNCYNENFHLKTKVAKLDINVGKKVKGVSAQCHETQTVLNKAQSNFQSRKAHITSENVTENKNLDQMQSNLNNMNKQMEIDIKEKNTLLEQQTKQIKENIDSNLEANKNNFKRSFEKKVEICYTFQGFDERKNDLFTDFDHSIKDCSFKSASSFIYNGHMPMGEYAPTFGPNSLLIHFVHATEFAEDRGWGDLVQKTASNFLYFKARYVVVLVAREMPELESRDITDIHSGIEEYWEVFKIITPIYMDENVSEKWKDKESFIHEFEELCADFNKLHLIKN